MKLILPNWLLAKRWEIKPLKSNPASSRGKCFSKASLFLLSIKKHRGFDFPILEIGITQRMREYRCERCSNEKFKNM